MEEYSNLLPGDSVVVFIEKQAVVGHIKKIINRQATISTSQGELLRVDARKLRIYKE